MAKELMSLTLAGSLLADDLERRLLTILRQELHEKYNKWGKDGY